ncbi:hypothetical protein HpHA44_08070 [Helicobacter pylori]
MKPLLKVFKGELDSAIIKGRDLEDLYLLESGAKKHGAKKILIRHYGVENTGGLTNDELINMGDAIKNGSVLLESFERIKNGFRYAYEWDNNGVKLRLVVDDLNDGNKIFDFYSDGNFTDFRDAKTQPSTSKDSRPLPTTLNEPNLTPKPLIDQEDLLKTSENLNETTQEAKNLSPLEQAEAEKLAKLESEKLESEKEFTRLKEQEIARKEALKKKLEHERGNAGNIESQTKIEVGEDIPTHTQKQIPKSRVRLNEREIYDLDYAIVKAKDLKPSFTTGGTQKRTDMNEEQIKSIAENFDPKKIFGSGGFEDLPIILHDGQVIAGNHRVQGMLNFTPKSRFAYERMVNREPNENNPHLKCLIEAVKDMQKENEKGLKEASKKSTKETTQKGIKERAFKVIEDKEAFFKDLNAIKPMQLPREIDTDSFLNAFNGVENKENFIKHLKNKPDAKHRLAYLHLVEPTLKEPDITLIFKVQGKEVKKEHIKAFQGDPKTIYYFLVTQDNDSKLITGLRTSENYIKAEIDKADIIHSFIPQDS